jgi:hypothetical protein
MDPQKIISAVQGLIASITAGLVSFGILGGAQASAIQAFIVSAIAFVSAIGIHSVRSATLSAEDAATYDPTAVPPANLIVDPSADASAVTPDASTIDGPTYNSEGV